MRVVEDLAAAAMRVVAASAVVAMRVVEDLAAAAMAVAAAVIGNSSGISQERPVCFRRRAFFVGLARR
jgi:hypothetical protein